MEAYRAAPPEAYQAPAEGGILASPEAQFGQTLPDVSLQQAPTAELALMLEKQALLERIEKSNSIPFADRLPFFLQHQAKEWVGVHELGHAVVGRRRGAKVRGISLNTTYPVMGVTEFDGFHSLDAFKDTVAAGAAAAGSDGLAGDKAMIAQVAQGENPDELFSAHQQTAASIWQQEFPDQRIALQVGRMMAYLGEVGGSEIDALVERAKLEQDMLAAGITAEDLMKLPNYRQILQVEKDRQQVEATRKTIPRAHEWTRKITTADTTIVERYRGEELVGREQECSICGSRSEAHDQARHEAHDRQQQSLSSQPPTERLGQSPPEKTTADPETVSYPHHSQGEKSNAVIVNRKGGEIYPNPLNVSEELLHPDGRIFPKPVSQKKPVFF